MENHMLLGDHHGGVDKPARLLSFEEHFSVDADLAEKSNTRVIPYHTVAPLRLGEPKSALPRSLVPNLLPPGHAYHTQLKVQQKVQAAIASAHTNEALRVQQEVKANAERIAKANALAQVARSKLPPPVPEPPRNLETPRTFPTKKRVAEEEAYVIKQ
jgi:hypothetical protein